MPERRGRMEIRSGHRFACHIFTVYLHCPILQTKIFAAEIQPRKGTKSPAPSATSCCARGACVLQAQLQGIWPRKMPNKVPAPVATSCCARGACIVQARIRQKTPGMFFTQTHGFWPPIPLICSFYDFSSYVVRERMSTVK
jgi:hypothetical protein